MASLPKVDLSGVSAGYLQSPWSAAQADQAATRLLTSTCVTVPGGAGAGARGGGGMPGSALAIILKVRNKLGFNNLYFCNSSSLHWWDLPFNLKSSCQGNKDPKSTPLWLLINSRDPEIQKKIQIPWETTLNFSSRSHEI